MVMDDLKELAVKATMVAIGKLIEETGKLPNENDIELVAGAIAEAIQRKAEEAVERS